MFNKWIKNLHLCLFFISYFNGFQRPGKMALYISSAMRRVCNVVFFSHSPFTTQCYFSYSNK